MLASALSRTSNLEADCCRFKSGMVLFRVRSNTAWEEEGQENKCQSDIADRHCGTSYCSAATHICRTIDRRTFPEAGAEVGISQNTVQGSFGLTSAARFRSRARFTNLPNTR